MERTEIKIMCKDKRVFVETQLNLYEKLSILGLALYKMTNEGARAIKVLEKSEFEVVEISYGIWKGQGNICIRSTENYEETHGLISSLRDVVVDDLLEKVKP